MRGLKLFDYLISICYGLHIVCINKTFSIRDQIYKKLTPYFHSLLVLVFYLLLALFYNTNLFLSI